MWKFIINMFYYIYCCRSQGLGNDIKLLQSILPEYKSEIKFFHFEDIDNSTTAFKSFLESIDTSDVLIFIEYPPILCYYMSIDMFSSFRTVFVPNIERVTNNRNNIIAYDKNVRSRTHFNSKFTSVLCKNQYTYNKLRNTYFEEFLKPDQIEICLDLNLKYTWFISDDHQSTIDNQIPGTILHNRGTSPYKGTKEILDAWANHPDLPLLTLKYSKLSPMHQETVDKYRDKQNIKVVGKYMESDEYKKFISEFEIALCISYAEGFGHYINEAMAMGKLVLVPDFPPMNEFITDGYDGFLIKPGVHQIQGISRGFFKVPNGVFIHPVDIVKKVKYVLSLDTDTKKSIKLRAIETFQARQRRAIHAIRTEFKRVMSIKPKEQKVYHSYIQKVENAKKNTKAISKQPDKLRSTIVV